MAIGIGIGSIPQTKSSILYNDTNNIELQTIELFNSHTDVVEVKLYQMEANGTSFEFFRQTLTAGCNHMIHYPGRDSKTLSSRGDRLEAEASVDGVVNYSLLGRRVG